MRMMARLARAFFQVLASRFRDGRRLPSWTFSFEWIVRFLRVDWEASAGGDIPALRKELDSRFYPPDFARKVKVSDEVLAGVPARWFVRKDAKREGGVVLYLHGGSFLYGSARTTHAELIARLAFESGVAAVGVDYRLAPEHPYPAALEDATRAFDALVADGLAPQRIVIAGDSSGGNLALALQLALRDRGVRAGGLVLLSPWADLTMPGASYVENDPFDYGTRAELVRHAAVYAGSHALDDPLVSPMFADLSGLPPAFVQAGTAELLRDDILALARKLDASGTEVTLDEVPEMPHNPCLLASLHPVAGAALARAATFIQRVTA